MIHPESKRHLTESDIDAFRKGLRWAMDRQCYYWHCRLVVDGHDNPGRSSRESMTALGIDVSFPAEWTDDVRENAAAEFLYGVWLAHRGICYEGYQLSGFAGGQRFDILNAEADDWRAGMFIPTPDDEFPC